MSKPPYKILVTTSDKYLDALKPFFYLLEKYWTPTPPDVYVVGFEPPSFELPPGSKFLSLGSMDQYPINRWSDQVIGGLHAFPEDVFIFMLEDMWITQPVYTSVVNMAYDYMIQFEYVARFDMTGDRLHSRPREEIAMHGMLGPHKIINSGPDAQYHMSTMPAFWRKEHLLSVLIPGETPWQVELQGTPRLAAMRETKMVLGTEVWPIRNTLAFRGVDLSKLLLDEIDPGDVTEMRELGLFEGLE